MADKAAKYVESAGKLFVRNRKEPLSVHELYWVEQTDEQRAHYIGTPHHVSM